ncbi:Uncharacterised protein [Cedecea neteri]|uniref:Uncharacterized protein n=1 Tax=Cedecea neteri TaxID=158822 RepID=A0A2X3J9A7_9ENTR|nr:Uncharacterised protein [Cedecea neteri]
MNGYGELMREHLIKPIQVELTRSSRTDALAQDSVQQEKAHE